MAVLTNKVLAAQNDCDGSQSFGPFLSVGRNEFRFDTSFRKAPIWLGHNASALYGIIQFQESWNGQWTEEIRRVRTAHQLLLSRCQSRICGQTDLGKTEPTSLTPAALIYQYISLSMLDQYESTHRSIANRIQAEHEFLASKYQDLIASSFVNGANFRFGFQFSERQDHELFCAALQKVGIENQPQFQRTPEKHNCDFALNLAFRDRYGDLFWQRLRLAFENFRDEGFSVDPVCLGSVPDQTRLFRFHRSLQKAKNVGKAPADCDPVSILQAEISERFEGLVVRLVDEQNYPQYRDQILAMQVEVYEPTRRTPAEEFDMLFESDKPLAIVVSNHERIAAMVFAGRLGLFRDLHGGITTDPFVDDPTVYYSMDLTVAPEFRGGVGRLMKQALVLLAIEHGVSAIHGRNRDRLAAGMWAINLSLGSYELQRLPDDYQDDEEFRDCIYYRCPLLWPNSLSESELGRFPVRRLLEGEG